MKLTLFALLLAATGCAELDLSAYNQRTPETARLREHAARVWADVGIEAPADYQVGLVSADELAVLCQGDGHGGCTYYDERAILIDAEQPAWIIERAIVHEVGHLLRGHHGHLKCGKDDTGQSDAMCPRTGPRTPELPTLRDVEFVTGR